MSQTPQRPMPEIEAIAARLARQGHRLTGSRRRVLRAVLAQPSHFTVDDVLRSAPHVGRATVFRTMKLLLDLDLVCRVLLDDGTLHYRVSARVHHHHLVCTECGRVEDFTRCDVTDLIRRLAPATDYEIQGHRLELYGRCRPCSERPRRAVRDG